MRDICRLVCAYDDQYDRYTKMRKCRLQLERGLAREAALARKRARYAGSS